MSRTQAKGRPSAPPPLDFLSALQWLDGRPLLETMEPYRRDLLTRALYTLRPDGTPVYNLVLSGRAKKNWKTTDLILAAFYRLLCWQSPQGNDCLILANDEDQAGDDLDLAKKLVRANPILQAECEIQSKEIIRRKGDGAMQILPARDVAGAHGKTALFTGFDEIHAYRNYDLIEALTPDPTRADALVWITSYDSIHNRPGVPLHDFKKQGLVGDDPRMLFSWYSGELCTDPAFADLPSEQRANPSMGSWPEGEKYLVQQRRRLPTHRYRRLHLNLPGVPEGAFLDADIVLAAIDTGRRLTPPQEHVRYSAFVDMSGGSADDACLSIAHRDSDRRIIVDLVISQSSTAPFNPRDAVRKFVRTLREYGISKIAGDAYAGETFRQDFEAEQISYQVVSQSKSELYEALEPLLNAGEIRLPDVPKLGEQLLMLIYRGSKIDHPNGEHDDWANAVAGAATSIPLDDAGGALWIHRVKTDWADSPDELEIQN